MSRPPRVIAQEIIRYHSMKLTPLNDYELDVNTVCRTVTEFSPLFLRNLADAIEKEMPLRAERLRRYADILEGVDVSLSEGIDDTNKLEDKFAREWAADPTRPQFDAKE